MHSHEHDRSTAIKLRAQDLDQVVGGVGGKDPTQNPYANLHSKRDLPLYKKTEARNARAAK